MKKHLFKIISSITLVIVVAFFVFFKFTEPTTSSYETTKTIVLPYLEPLTETEILAFTEPEEEVEELPYSELVNENPAIADIKTYEQLDEYYNLETVTEVPEGAIPLELISLKEAIEHLENIRRYQMSNLK